MPVVLSGIPNAARQQIQVDFTHDPSSSSFTWVDITNRARAASYRRGRSYERGTVDVGGGQLKLRNDDGALDPTNAGSTYAPNVIPYRRIQHNVTVLGVTYPVFTGLVERWPQEWSVGYGYSPVQVVDFFAWLGAGKLRSVVQQEILADAPAGYWPLSDPANSTSAGSLVGGAAATVATSKWGAGSLTFGTSTTLTDSTTAVTVASPDSGSSPTLTARATYLTAPTVPPAGSGFAIELWARTANTAASGALYSLPRITSGFLPGQVFFKVRGSSSPGYDAEIGGTAANIIASNTTPLHDAAWHHIVMVLESDQKTCHIYIDGNLDSTTVAGSPIAFPSVTSPIALGVMVGASTPTAVEAPFSGDLAGFAVYSAPLTAARVLAHYTAGLNGFAGETANARIARILRYAGWTATTDLDVCTTTMLAASMSGKSALDAVTEVATSEGGVFFASKAGVLTYRSRRTRMQTTTSAATFGDGVGETPYVDIAFDFDPTYVYNDVQVTRTGAATISAKSSASQVKYGVRSLPLSIDTQSDAEARDEADWTLNAYANPSARVRSVTIDCIATPGGWAAVLPLEVGSRVTVKRRPVGGTITVNSFVESVAFDIVDVTRARCTLELSPIPLQALIADDATYGVCDSTFVAAW